MGRIRNAAAHDPLSDLYLPQIEQFRIPLVERGAALTGSASHEDADARVVVYRMGAFGVVTSHRIRVKRAMPFVERGVPGLCVTTLSADSLALCPVARPGRPRAAGNVAVFGQERYERSCPLRAGSVQDAVSVTLLPDWFRRWEGPSEAAALRLIETAAETCVNGPERSLDALLRSVTPLFGGALADERRLFRCVEKVAALTVAWYVERERAEAACGTLGQARLVRAARHLVLQHLQEDLSLARIAHDLLVSRTRLCEAFRRETGEGLGSYVKRARMERAEALLAVGAVPVAEVARAVGYGRTASFTVAFERAHGCSPSAWRRSSRVVRP